MYTSNGRPGQHPAPGDPDQAYSGGFMYAYLLSLSFSILIVKGTYTIHIFTYE